MNKNQKRTVHPGDSLFIVINSFDKNGKLVKGITRLIIRKIDHSFDEEFIFRDEKDWTRSKSSETRIHCYACNNFQVKAINVITGRERVQGFFDDLGDMKIFNKSATFKNGKKCHVKYPGRLYYSIDDNTDKCLEYIDSRIPIFTSFENAAYYLLSEKNLLIKSGHQK